MRIDWYTLALQTVNFAVLVWLLQRFLYRPVLRTVDLRRAQIDKAYADAHRAEAEAREHLSAIDAQRASIATERAKVLAAAAAEADVVRAARRASAEQEAAALLVDTRKTLATERTAALEEAERCALDLAAQVARRLLGDLPERLRTDAWLDGILRHLAALSPSERAALAAELSPTVPVTIVTATALSAASKATWRERLATALGGGTVDFSVDSTLGAGAEIHLPNAILRFSLSSELAALRAELEHHADACG
jgi:F-type H+-transporting ATPase subunit b